MDNPYRRSSALYQLSVLYLDLKQGDRALETRASKPGGSPKPPAARSRWSNARMAESAALEILERPERELAAMQEALAIARKSQSQDRRVACAHQPRPTSSCGGTAIAMRWSLARRSLELALRVSTTRDLRRPARRTWGSRSSASAAWPKASGSPTRRSPTTSAPARPPRSRRSLGEYGQYLEKAGDYKAALALFHRERKLNDEIAARGARALGARAAGKIRVGQAPARDRAPEPRERRSRSPSFENRQAAAARLVAARRRSSAISFVVVAVLYRKLRVTNRPARREEPRAHRSRAAAIR